MVCVEVNLVVLVEVFELLEVGFELLLILLEAEFELPLVLLVEVFDLRKSLGLLYWK